MVPFWSRFVHKHDAHQNHSRSISFLSRFWRPPSRVDLVLQVKPTSAQTLLDVTSSFHPSKQMQLLICAYVYTVSVSNFGTLKTWFSVKWQGFVSKKILWIPKNTSRKLMWACICQQPLLWVYALTHLNVTYMSRSYTEQRWQRVTTSPTSTSSFMASTTVVLAPEFKTLRSTPSAKKTCSPDTKKHHGKETAN